MMEVALPFMSSLAEKKILKLKLSNTKIWETCFFDC